MTKDSVSGTALIIGTLTGVVTMAFHPSGADFFRAGADVDAVALRNMAAHSLAIVGVWLTLFGAVGLTRRIDDDHGIATAALVAYALAAFAVLIAAVASGFIATNVVRHIVPANEGAKGLVTALLEYTGIMNQAFAKINVVASAVAIALWSWVIVARGVLPRGIGFTGFVVAALCAAAVVAGLPLNIHVFGGIVLAQTVWLIAVGVAMRRPA
jgi:hypothetical protein